MWRYFQISLSIYKAIDFIVDHRDYIRDVVPGLALVSALAMSLWALVLGQSAPVIVTLALLTGIAIFIFFTYVPWWLKTRFPHPLEISILETLHSKRGVQMPVSIINRSSKDHMVLEFAMCLQEKDGKQTWLKPEVLGIPSSLNPQDKTEGMIIYGPIGPKDQSYLPLEAQILLQVTDRISTRRIRLEVPGSYPPKT